MGNDKNVIDLNEARTTLGQVAENRPSLAGPAAVLNEVLPVLFAADSSPKIELTEAAALEKLKSGVPLLRGERLVFERQSFLARWSAVCTALERHQGDPEATRLSASLRDGTLEIDRLVDLVLAGAVGVIAAEAETAGLNPALLASVLRLTLLPFLSEVTLAFAPILAQHQWGQGFCGVCGSWPLLAELRGLIG